MTVYEVVGSVDAGVATAALHPDDSVILVEQVRTLRGDASA